MFNIFDHFSPPTQASFKLYGALVRNYEGDELDDEAESLGTFYLEGIAMYMDSSNLEVL